MAKLLVFLCLLGGFMYVPARKFIVSIPNTNRTTVLFDTVRIIPNTSSMSEVAPVASGNIQKAEYISYIKENVYSAQLQEQLYRIPTCITLAQALVESNAGKSRLALTAKNHFGIKCVSKTCPKGHCVNFTDDHHKDFFVVYPTINDSYTAHSKFLQGERYKNLYQLKTYQQWAHALKKDGYATDSLYAEKLIGTIELYQLHLFNLNKMQ